MATTTKTPKTQTPVTQTPEPQAQTPQPTQAQLDLLMAQKKQLEDAIKAAKAAMPKQSPLDTEIARQQDAGVRNNFVGPFYAKLIQRRIALGQDRDTAIAEVQALWTTWTLAALTDLPAKGE